MFSFYQFLPCATVIVMQYISLFSLYFYAIYIPVSLYCYAIYIPVFPVLLCNIYPCFPCIVMQYISLFSLGLLSIPGGNTSQVLFLLKKNIYIL